ncbi:TetR/AcrR family transcriptional regulator [Limosilactobacillus sp.]|uniref:TetR/AcrR family transcriptional regulator n=1 Tax=Limosilactobacillus sp. TaxID=2773925 RepID=UPI00345E33D7
MKQDKRKQLVYRILNQLLKTGFENLKMDDFINMMSASRSTVYRHFKSREDIIDAVVDEYIQYLQQFTAPQFPTSADEWVKSLEQQLEKTLVLNSHLSSIFLHDLHDEFPEKLERLQTHISQYDDQQIAFFNEGQRQSIFNKTRPELWILQDRLMIPKLIDPNYLVSHKLTVNTVIDDYVSMKKSQILKTEYQNKFDPSFTKSIISKITKEIRME